MKERTKERVPAGARAKLPVWFYPLWSTNGIVMSLSAIVIGYATFYCTDVLGLNVGIVGILMLIIRFSDGVTDLLVGHAIDNTHTRLGQARPYEISVVFLWIFMIAFYSTPGFSTTGKYIWIFIMYFMVTAVCQTIAYGENPVYLMNAVPDANNRNKLVSISGAIMMVASIAFGIIAPQFIDAAGSSSAAWRQLIIAIGVPCAILGVVRMIFIKEANVKATSAEKEEKIDFKTSIKVLGQNKYILIFSVVYFLYQFALGFTNTMGTYYFKYYIGDIGAQSFMGVAMFFTPILLLIAPALIKKFGTRKVLIGGSVFGILSPVVRLFCNKNLIILFISSVFSAVAMVPVAMLLSIYIFECMEYGEWKSNIRIDGIISCMNSVAAKVALGLSSVVAGLVLNVAHYDGTLEVQSAGAMTAIHLLYTWIPIALGVVALIFAFRYDVEKQLPEIRAELAQRHADAEAAD
ncbi:MAG: MFS transporter [Clostridia bacterium]|nr:MFS transporter [Clostridia bacterium]